MNDEVIFKSKSQYSTRYFYIPFLLTGISLGILFIRFVIGHIYEFQNWIVNNIGFITIATFLVELLLVRILGKYHIVLIQKKENELSFDLFEDNNRVVQDDIENIIFFWDYFSKSPITEKEYKTDRGYLFQRLLCEIDTKENGKFWLSQELLFFQEAPSSWGYKKLEMNEKDKLYVSNKLKLLKNKISKIE